MGEKTDFAKLEGRSCRACKYYDTVTSVIAAQAQSVCRLEPPRVFAQPVAVSGAQVQWASTTFWPAVASTDFCSHFTQRMDS